MFQEPEGEILDGTTGFLLTVRLYYNGAHSAGNVQYGSYREVTCRAAAQVSFILDQKASELSEKELWRILYYELRGAGVLPEK